MYYKGIKRFLLCILCVTFVQMGFAQKFTVINQKGTKIDVVSNTVTISNTEPSIKEVGDVWFDATANVSKIYNGSIWVEIDPDKVTTSDVEPSTPASGDVWFDTTINNVVTKVYNGTVWQELKVVSSDINNQIEVGTNGGAYLGPTVYTGFFIIDFNDNNSNKTIIDIPFQPSQVTFVAHANVESFTDPNDTKKDLDSDGGFGNNTRGINNSFGTMNGFANNSTGVLSQGVIYVGGHGNSINYISRFASSNKCIGVRYGNQNGDSLGSIKGVFNEFTSNGFNIGITYTDGTITVNDTSPVITVQTSDVQNEKLIVMYTAYK